MLTILLDSEPPAPLSKSAIKKAKALARAEKRQQEKAARAAARNLANGKASPDTSPPIAESYVDVSAEVGESGVDSEISSPTESTSDKGKWTGVEPTVEAKKGNGNAHPLVQQVESKPTSRAPVTPVTLSAPPPPPSTKAAQEVAAPPQKQTLSQLEKASTMANGHSKHVPVPPTEPDTSTQSAAEKSKKRQSFLTRTLWTFIMIGGFISTLMTSCK